MRHSHTLAGFEASGLRKALQSELEDKPQSLAETRSLAEIEQEVLAAYDQFAAHLFRYARALGKDTEQASIDRNRVLLLEFLDNHVKHSSFSNLSYTVVSEFPQ
jgi:hypothetical protein